MVEAPKGKQAWWLLWLKAPKTLMPGASPSCMQVLFLGSGERLAEDVRCTTCLLHAVSLSPTKDTGGQGHPRNHEDPLRPQHLGTTSSPCGSSPCAPCKGHGVWRNCGSLCLEPFQYSGWNSDPSSSSWRLRGACMSALVYPGAAFALSVASLRFLCLATAPTFPTGFSLNLRSWQQAEGFLHLHGIIGKSPRGCGLLGGLKPLASQPCFKSRLQCHCT